VTRREELIEIIRQLPEELLYESRVEIEVIIYWSIEESGHPRDGGPHDWLGSLIKVVRAARELIELEP